MNDQSLKTSHLGPGLYRYVWAQSRKQQIAICVLTMVLAPLMMVPLELQRQITNKAVESRDVTLLIELGIIYFLVICVQGGMKYALNMLKGQSVEVIARDIRQRIVERVSKLGPSRQVASTAFNAGTVVSLLAAETEDVSAFGGDAFGLPMLTGGTILYVTGYLLWVEPAIAVLAVIIYMPQALLVPMMQFFINRLARLRILNVRSLGRLAADGMGGRESGFSIINRIYKLRMAIYLRKYALTALGNFLDAFGVIIVLIVGGYFVIQGQTQVGTLVVFMSGLNKIADPWDELINFYRTISNTAVSYEMIRTQIEGDFRAKPTEDIPPEPDA